MKKKDNNSVFIRAIPMSRGANLLRYAYTYEIEISLGEQNKKPENTGGRRELGNVIYDFYSKKYES